MAIQQIGPTSSVGSSVIIESKQPPTVDDLLVRIAELEAAKKAAEENAAGFREQYETLKARGPISREMTTTTTKPTFKFTVTSERGQATFDVVDESEAKRLYCIQFRIEPSDLALTVTSDESERRKATVLQQYKEAGVKPEDVKPVSLMV